MNIAWGWKWCPRKRNRNYHHPWMVKLERIDLLLPLSFSPIIYSFSDKKGYNINEKKSYSIVSLLLLWCYYQFWTTRGKRMCFVRLWKALEQKLITSLSGNMIVNRNGICTSPPDIHLRNSVKKQKKPETWTSSWREEFFWNIVMIISK